MSKSRLRVEAGGKKEGKESGIRMDWTSQKASLYVAKGKSHWVNAEREQEINWIRLAASLGPQFERPSRQISLCHRLARRSTHLTDLLCLSTALQSDSHCKYIMVP